MTGLAQHAEQIARALLGEPNKHLSSKSQLRFGTHGSVAVEIAGAKCGRWYDHETETGGGLLALIVRERGGARRNAVDWIKSLGIDLASSNGAAGPPRRRAAEYVYHARAGEPLFRVVRWHPKTFTQERFDSATGKFVGGKGCMAGVRRVPYRLHEWVDESGRVWVAEGEKDVDNLVRLGELATTNAGGAGKWNPDFAPYFAGREVIICGDNDQAGKKHVRDVAANLSPVARSVRIVWLPPLVGKDASDWFNAGHTLEELLTLDAAPEEEQPVEEEDKFTLEVGRLAQLPPHEYDRVRKAEAKRLDVRIATLDAAVQAIRDAGRSEDSAGKGQALDLPEPEAWPEPVEGVLDDLIAAIRKYVSLDEHKAIAVALWAVHAHCMEWADVAPRLHVTSPAPNCGKTVLLDTVARLVPRPLLISNISPAGIFRTVEACRPTMLVDEFDTFGTDDEQVRGLLNSGHTRTSAFVIRVVEVGGDLEPRRFATWGALAVAGIGKVPATIASRSIVVEMARKLPGDRVARLTHRGGQDLDVLCRKIARWTADNRARLEGAAPNVPAQLSNRAADNWAELLTVAALHGDDWTERARRAALSLTSTDYDDAGYGIALLEDIKTAIGKAEQISTENLLKHLHAMTERPWCEYGRARKPISPRLLAGLLKPFGIASSTIRESEISTPKGYRREQFESAWDRYLSATAPQPGQSATFCDFSSATKHPDVAHRNSEKPKQSAACGVVADKTPPLCAEVGPICAHCGRPIDGSDGYTAASSGEVLHNPCVDAWTKGTR